MDSGVVDSVVVFLQASEARGGQRFPPDDLIRGFRALDRRASFIRLAEIAAALANRDDALQESQSMTRSMLAQFGSSRDAVVRQMGVELLGIVARSRPRRVIWHEKLVYLMQSLVLTEAASAGGLPPEDWRLTLLALGLNDYALDWSKHGSDLTELEQQLADFLHIGRFNVNSDPVREIVRGELLLTRALPRHPKFQTAEDWESLQRSAFGRPYSEHVDRFLGPLAFQAMMWMRDPRPGKPLVTPWNWSEKMEGGAEPGRVFIESLTGGADAVSTAIRDRSGKNVVRFPFPFYRTPLISFGPGEDVVGVSPGAMNHQLAFGFWGRLLGTLKEQLGDTSGVKTWMGIFGDLFEMYCRWLAQEAQKSESFPKEAGFLASTMGGEDEIEDLVLAAANRVVLFSCKARLMREEQVRGAESPQALLKWMESFFFEEGGGEQRGGAFRLLERKVAAIRDGRYEPTIDRNALIYPVVLTYDHVGDSLLISRWLESRLQQLDLLQQPATRLPLVLSADSFEVLMGLAAHGVSILRVLDLCASEEGGGAMFKHTITKNFSAEQRQRLPVLMAEFMRLTQRIKSRFTDVTDLPATSPPKAN